MRAEREYKLKAEFDRHDCTVLFTPLRRDVWRDNGKPAREAVFSLAKIISKYEKVYLGYDKSVFDKEELLRKLKRLVRNMCKAIVLDSASGDQFAAVLATQAVNRIVCCMRPTMQHRIGGFKYLQRLASKNIDADDKKFIILPTVVPNADRVIGGENQRAWAKRDMLERIGFTKLSGVSAEFVGEECFGINEVERFKWQEGILYNIKKTETLTGDETEAYKRYERLAGLLIE